MTSTKQAQFQHHHTLAQRGDKESQYWTGKCYWEGNGVEQNMASALPWYQRAANQNSGKAKYKLGFCYLHGFFFVHGVRIFSVQRDENKGKKLLRQAIPLLIAEAENGDSEAMLILGEAHGSGCGQTAGIPKDNGKALHWMRRAAEKEHPRAQFWLGQGHQHGRYGLPANDQRAFYWFRRAAENGDVFAQEHLGERFENGEGQDMDAPHRDWIQALYWYQRSKENSGHCQQLDRLQKQIATDQARFVQHVKSSLRKTSSSGPLGLWAHGLAILAVRHHQPVGFSPTFLALRGLVPQVFSSK